MGSIFNNCMCLKVCRARWRFHEALEIFAGKKRSFQLGLINGSSFCPQIREHEFSKECGAETGKPVFWAHKWMESTIIYLSNPIPLYFIQSLSQAEKSKILGWGYLEWFMVHWNGWAAILYHAILLSQSCVIFSEQQNMQRMTLWLRCWALTKLGFKVIRVKYGIINLWTENNARWIIYITFGFNNEILGSHCHRFHLKIFIS